MLATYITCNNCGERFDPHRPTRLDNYDGKRCKYCGEKHRPMAIERENIGPKSGGGDYIYLMSVTGAIKIGVSKQPETRKRQSQQGNQDNVKLVKSWPCENAYAVEKQMHARLFDKSISGEWFEYDTSDLTGLVNAMELFIDSSDKQQIKQ